MKYLVASSKTCRIGCIRQSGAAAIRHCGSLADDQFSFRGRVGLAPDLGKSFFRVFGYNQTLTMAFDNLNNGCAPKGREGTIEADLVGVSIP